MLAAADQAGVTNSMQSIGLQLSPNALVGRAFEHQCCSPRGYQQYLADQNISSKSTLRSEVNPRLDRRRMTGRAALNCSTVQLGDRPIQSGVI